MGLKFRGAFHLGAVLLSILFVVGCATQTRILEVNTYVGNDVRDVIRDYGAPVHAHDTERGGRAFQWEMDASYSYPRVNNEELEDRWLSRKHIGSRGKAKTSCLYTFYTEWSKARHGWIVVNHVNPQRVCLSNDKDLPRSTYAGVSGSY